jgi:tetratricopeptide (TPR) repeat protein
MAEKQTDPRKNFVPRILPWLLAAAMFVVYAVTLNRWISLASIPSVTQISGSWLPDLTNPLLFIVTYPFRWLPAGAIPVALNFFAAACAAISLGLLARCVAILPHDRTDAQRKREHSDFSFLTIRSAWLPPLLAVVVCGLQMTFWEHATNFTGEMFDLLIFAFLIWSLMEYRLDEREGRLYLASFICGLNLAENWAMTGFFPIFLAALIWIRGISFFEWPFLKRMILLGVAGLLLFFLLPLIAVISSNVSVTFWQALKFNTYPQYNVLKNCVYIAFHPLQSADFLCSLIPLIPLLMLSIRWPQSFGDASRLGQILTTIAFHLVHAVFLVILAWIAFDSPISPHARGGNAPFLTIYFLGALSIGYYCGYFLLIFGVKEKTSRPRQPSAIESASPIVFAAVWLFAIVAVGGLIYRNVPQITAENGDTLRRYAEFIVKKLPSSGYLMSDDPQRLALVEAALADDGRAKNFVPLETEWLVQPSYHRYLHKKFPAMWPEIVSATQTNLLNPLGLVQLVGLLSRSNEIFYLHPGDGYYFEQFYAEPHGVVYQLKPLPENSPLPPKAGANLIAENENFWTQAATALAPIEKAVAPADPNAPESFGEKVLSYFHISRDPNPNDAVAGEFYSRSADFWGVQLQRAGQLEKAAAQFALATNLNPDNVIAAKNLDFNAKLRAHETVPVDLSETGSDQFTKYATWSELLNANGPFDEPGFCFQDGMVLAQGNGFYRQAAAEFERVRELDPDFLPARLMLGQIYLMSRLPDRAVDALQEPLEHPEKFGLAETNETQLHVLASAAYFQKNEPERAAKLLQTEIALHPDDNDLLGASTQVFIQHGLYNDALAVIDQKLKSAPDDAAWLYMRGSVEVQLKKYDAAISDLSRVLAVQTNNYGALFDRAVANLQSGKLDAARADYQKLQQNFTNSFPVAYGLGEIAYRHHETNEAVRNYEIYLANNPNTNTDEAKMVADRLNSLRH